MANAQARGATRETTVGNQGTLFTQVHALDIRGGIEHLLHTRTTLRSFVGNDDTVAALHLTAEDSLTGIFLRVEHHCGTFEVPQGFIHTGSLHHAAVLSDVAEEHGQSTILGVGMLKVADATVGAVSVQRGILLRLRTHLRREAVARSGVIDRGKR